MKQPLPSSKLKFGAALLLLLLLTGCVAVQPAPASGNIPSADNDVVLTWEGAPLHDATQCAHLAINSSGQATFGLCGEAGTVQPLGAHAQEWSAMQARFAAFTYTTETTTLTFNGAGDVAGDAWQRALTAWAQLRYSELSSGRTSASVATALSWFLGAAPAQADLCQHVTVLVYGYAYAETVPCAGGAVLESIGDWLADAEMTQFDQWLYHYVPLYAADNYLAGVGTQNAGAAELEQVQAWAQALSARLQTSGAHAATATETGAETEEWKSYQADSGYRIQYPLALYSLRAGLSGPHVLFPGVRVVEPNDAFTYRDPSQAVYKLSIAVSTNEQGLTMAEPAALLANSAFIVYEPTLLADHTLQQIELDGIPALRVDDLPTGPAGITTQIVALHNDFIYELLVEPHIVTTNQADSWVESVPNTANHDLIEQIVGTFRFTD